jgi:hypothetical protein
MRRIFSFSFCIFSFFALLVLSSAPVLAADAWDKTSLSTAFTGLSTSSIDDIIKNLADWLLYIVGFISIIAFIIAGIQYLMAGANEDMAEHAKKTMLWAIIGTIVAISGLVFIYAADHFLNGSTTI